MSELRIRTREEFARAGHLFQCLDLVKQQLADNGPFPPHRVVYSARGDAFEFQVTAADGHVFPSIALPRDLIQRHARHRSVLLRQLPRLARLPIW